MNHSYKISAIVVFFILKAGIALSQIVDASPETQTICSGGSATLTAVILPSGTSSLPTTSYAIAGIGYAPNSYTSGTVVPSSDDTQSGPFPIGFNFEFFGTCYTQFYIGSNGWVAFSPQPTTYASSAIPSTGASIPKNCVMGPWQDWLPAASNIRYQTLGILPNRRLVVSWNACPMYSCTSNLGTFQIVLYESTNVIENFIQNKPNCMAWSGGTGVQGVHNAAGTVAFTVPGRNSTAWTATNEGWRYTPNGVFTPVISWYVLPSNTLVGTGTPITVTPPAGAPSTSYYASITGGSGCGTANSTDTVVVLQTIVPALTAGNNGPVCAGATLNLSCLPTTAGATYSWTGPGGFTSTLQNPSIPAATIAASGVYTVTMTLAGCSGAPVTTTATVNPVPATPVAAGTTPICSGTTLNLSTTSTGPTWTWTGPSAFSSALQNPSVVSAPVTASGTYSVTATSAAGCVSLPGTVNITVNPTPVAPTAANQSICFGMSATLTASGSGATYQWYDVPGGTLLGTGATYTTPAITSTTNYSVQSTALGCTGPITTITVTVSPSITVNAGLDDSICSGGNYTLGVTPSGGGYTYLWDAPGTPGFSTSGTPNVTPAATTSYTVTVTDALGCTGTDAVMITKASPFVLNATGTPASCAGSCNGTGTITATGSFGGYSYGWSNGSTATALSSLCANTYTVIVTDMFGCTAQDTIMVNQPTPLALTLSSTSANCNQPDGSATVIANGGVGGYSYLWSPGGQTTAAAINLIPGMYCVTVTDANGCSGNVCINVANTPGVISTITSTPVTCNGLCNGTASVTASSGSAPYAYLWSNGQTTPAITGLCPGIYTCTVTDASGCTATSSATITEPAIIVIDVIPAVTICIGQSTTLNASATGGHASGGYTFNWMTPAFTGPSNTVSPTVTTTYTVTATDTAGCMSLTPQTVTVTVNPPLGVTTSPNVSICPGINTTLSSTPSGGDGTYTYSWMPGAGAGSTFTVSPAATITYTITITDGCTATPVTANITVTVLPLPVVSLSPNVTTGCDPTCVIFTDASTIASGTITGWNWNFGDGNTSLLQNPAPNCYNAGSFDITLTVTSNGGCSSTSTINNMITIYPQPVAQFTFGPQPTTTENPTITFTDLSVNAVTWSWDFADPSNLYEPNFSSQMNPTHTYGDTGLYCVTLTVQSLGGCADVTTNCLTIAPEYTFYIPSGFTPNGDALNPIFAPQGQNIKEFTMRIFDRWGNMIFRSGFVNEGWDGKVQNKSEQVAEQDVYVYNIDVKDNLGKRHNYIGTVTIVK